MKHIAVRITEHVSGRHVWEIGRFATATAARHARNEAIEEAAHHFMRHRGRDGFVAITPLADPLGIAVTLYTADGRAEAEYLFGVLTA